MSEPREYNQFKGLQLPIDRKRIADPYVVDGKNFIFDIDGPYSGLGRAWVASRGLQQPKGAQSLRNVDNSDVYWFDVNCICRYDSLTGNMYSVFDHVTRILFWPWSRAVVGGMLYLTNIEVGIVQYNPVTQLWKIITSDHIPTLVIGCCESYGRLIISGYGVQVFSDGAVLWSTIDDGTDFHPATTTGTGYQFLSRLASRCLPFSIVPYADGFLTYTSEGIMKSEAQLSQNPFRHFILSREHKLINPWAVCILGSTQGETQLMVTPRGFFTTTGDKKPVQWESVQSEYLHTVFFRRVNYRDQAFILRLDYNSDTGWLAVSVADDSRSSTYSRALMYYQPLITDSWGVYSRAHMGFSEVYLSSGPYKGFHYGVVDVTGAIYRFSFTDADQLVPVAHDGQIQISTYIDFPPIQAASSVTEFRDSVQFDSDELELLATTPGFFDADYLLSSTIIVITEGDETPLGSAPTEFVCSIGFDAASDNIVVRPELYTLAALDASITIGPIMAQMPDGTQIDRITQSQEAIVSMLAHNIGDIFEDWLLDSLGITIIEDYNTEDVQEDWGEAAGDSSEYTTQFIGTLDGYSTWQSNGQEQSLYPSLIAQTGRNRHLAGCVSGVYLLYTFSAMNLGEQFHLKLLRTRLLDAGQLL